MPIPSGLIKTVYKIKSLEQQIKIFTEEIQKNREKIQSYFDKKEIKSVVIEAPEVVDSDFKFSTDLENSYLVVKAERVEVNYLLDKLRVKLGKNVFSKIVHKTYTINNIYGLVELLKKAGVSPKDFKKFIEVEETLNKEALKQKYALGEITKEDLRGCYLAKIVKSIQIRSRKEGSAN